MLETLLVLTSLVAMLATLFTFPRLVRTSETLREWRAKTFLELLQDSQLLCLVFLLGFAGHTYAECTASVPLMLPVTDVVLSGGDTLRGIRASIGLPNQNISFFPKITSLIHGYAVYCLPRMPHQLC